MYGGPTHQHQDIKNTTIIPLAAAAVFTGDWQLNTAADVMVSYATSGTITLSLQYSDNNGTNFRSDDISVEANADNRVIRTKGSQFFRIKITNTSGGTLSFLRIFTYYGDFSSASDIITTGATTLGSGIALSNTVSTTILAANSNRNYIAISVRTNDVWIKLQAASVDNNKKGIFLSKDFTYELHPKVVYTGEISAIIDPGTGGATAYTTEF